MQFLFSGGGVELTIDCIESLQKSSIEGLTIIVVDNFSPDDSLDVIRRYASGCVNKNIIVLAAKENNGFSAGNNIGINYAIDHGADYVLLINNDTVVDPNMVLELEQNCDDKHITVPKIFYFSQPDLLWYAGGRIDYKKGRFYHLGENEPDSPKYSKKRKVDFATGCCLMIPKNIIQKVGTLYEPFFMYCEDVEYSLRVQKNGFSILYCPDAKLWHKVSSTSGSKSKMSLYYGNRNRLFVLKMYDFVTSAWIFTVSTRLIYYFRGLVTHSDERIIGRAIKDYHRGVLGKVAL